jgi:hypothetical protein
MPSPHARWRSGSRSTARRVAVIELDDHRPLEPGFAEVGSAVEWLCSQLWDVTVRVRQRGELLGGLDAVSQHVVVEVQRELEAQLWMPRAQQAD